MRKPAPPRDIPPPLELECLRVLWQTGEANVREVRDTLAARKPLAYTTVMTLLDRLVRRGSAARRKVGRFFVYAPTVSRESLRAVAVRELTESFFDGDRAELLRYLQGGVPIPAPVRVEPVRIVAEPPVVVEERPAPAERLDTALL